MTAPIAYCLTRGIFQRLVATLYRKHLCAKHLHAFYIRTLTLHVKCTHIDPARHIHQSADGSRRHTMLTSTCLSHYASLAHLLCNKYLSYRIINLMSTSMIKIFTL